MQICLTVRKHNLVRNYQLANIVLNQACTWVLIVVETEVFSVLYQDIDTEKLVEDIAMKVQPVEGPETYSPETAAHSCTGLLTFNIYMRKCSIKINYLITTNILIHIEYLFNTTLAIKFKMKKIEKMKISHVIYKPLLGLLMVVL